MSLTQSEMVYLGALEQAANVVIDAICTTRPRYLARGSVPYRSPSDPNVSVDPPVFGTPWMADLGMPTVDFSPGNTGWPVANLPLAIDHFGIAIPSTKLTYGQPSSAVAYLVNIYISGNAALLPNSQGYDLVLSADPNGGFVETGDPLVPIPPFTLLGLQFGLISFLSTFPPVTLPLPPLAIGPIIPGIGPLVDIETFMLRGSL